MGRGDRLWSGKDGNCFSQYSYISANLSLVTCSIRLKSRSWFTVTCLLSHCSDGHLCPQSKNTWSCESASELYSYIQMGGTDRNFYLEGGDRKLQNSLVRSGREAFPTTVRSILEGCCFPVFCCYPSSFSTPLIFTSLFPGGNHKKFGLYSWMKYVTVRKICESSNNMLENRYLYI